MDTIDPFDREDAEAWGTECYQRLARAFSHDLSDEVREYLMSITGSTEDGVHLWAYWVVDYGCERAIDGSFPAFCQHDDIEALGEAIDSLEAKWGMDVGQSCSALAMQYLTDPRVHHVHLVDPKTGDARVIPERFEIDDRGLPRRASVA